MQAKVSVGDDSRMASSSPKTATAKPSVIKSEITVKSLSLTNTVGGRIQWARTRRKITQAELAKKIGKARATVVQYENDNIPLSLDVCESIARTLLVAPEYLAFGVQGLQGVNNAVEEIATLKEITYGADGKYASGNWAMPSSILTGLGLSANKTAFYTVPRASVRFNFQPGMRLLVDRSIDAYTADHEVYLVEAGNSIEPVSFETDLTDSSKLKVLTGNGGTQEVNKGDITIIGAVVGYFNPVM